MKTYKFIGVIGLLVFSFYLTDLITDIAINKNNIMQTIKKTKNSYVCEAVNAIIEDNTIIPGINGKIVNEMDSFLNMKDFGYFNSNYLVYDDIKPDISIIDNLDKIIISGNKEIRNVSLLINNNVDIMNYLDSKKLDYSKLINYNTIKFYKENINIESDKKRFLDLDTLLNKKNLNNKICIVDYSNIEVCKEKKYYIVKPSLTINNNNLYSNLKVIQNGSIIIIEDSLNIDSFKILLKNIYNKDLKLVYLSKIIEE